MHSVRTVTVVPFGLALLSAGVWGGSVAFARQQTDMVKTHIGHVTTSFQGTPMQQGFLPTAVAEAKTAAQHAVLAMKSEGNLEAMKLHAGHVLHALDPSVELKGPGLNYGVKRAAMGVAQHIEFAAKVPSASKNVMTHASHISASARNVVQRADEMVAVVQQIRAATTAAEAAPHAAHLNMLAQQLYAGFDANKDGQVGWQTGEGGLQQSEAHVEFMLKAEGTIVTRRVPFGDAGRTATRSVTCE